MQTSVLVNASGLASAHRGRQQAHAHEHHGQRLGFGDSRDIAISNGDRIDVAGLGGKVLATSVSVEPPRTGGELCRLRVRPVIPGADVLEKAEIGLLRAGVARLLKDRLATFISEVNHEQVGDFSARAAGAVVLPANAPTSIELGAAGAVQRVCRWQAPVVKAAKRQVLGPRLGRCPAHQSIGVKATCLGVVHVGQPGDVVHRVVDHAAAAVFERGLRLARGHGDGHDSDVQCCAFPEH